MAFFINLNHQNAKITMRIKIPLPTLPFRAASLFTVAFTLLTVAAAAQDSTLLPNLIAAEKLFDLQFTSAKRDSILSGLENNLHFYQYLHQHNLYNDVPLSLG